MAPARKLTISIPEELARRLEPWRDRMNISRVCSEAIKTEVIFLEDMWHDWRRRPETVKGFALLIERLQSVIRNSYQLDYIHGYDDGTEYAQEHAQSEDFERYEKLTPTEIQQQGLLPKQADERLSLLVREGDVADSTLYRMAWLQGMSNVWEQIKEEPRFSDLGWDRTE